MRVTIVAANSGEFDSRLRRTARALADDGHVVTIVAWSRPGLPPAEVLGGGVTLRRVALDLRVTSAFRPLPQLARRGLARALGFDPDATVLPPGRPSGLDRLRAPLRRGSELLAHVRRAGPWARAVVTVAPADVYHAKALVALPVIRTAAHRTGGRFVYDIADLHVEAARLARMPGIVRRLISGREAGWVREAAGLTAVSDAVAHEVARRYGVAEPAILLNTPPAWRLDEPLEALDDGRLRAAAGLGPDTQIVLYQGGLSIDRGIEELVAAIDEPGLAGRDVALVFLGYGRLRDWLAGQAAARPGRIVVLDAVPLDELLGYTAGATIGYVGQPGRTLNQRLNLANKLFESWMAGVPVLVSSETEHCRVVTEHDGGVCADTSDPVAVATALAGLVDQPAASRLEQRRRLRALALGRFSWDIARAGVVERYRALAADGAAGGSGAGRLPIVALLLNNPYVADSRAWKLAGTYRDAGAAVTVVARAADGLPAREEIDGVRVVRIEQPRPLRRLPAARLPDAPAGEAVAGRSRRPSIGDPVRRAIQGLRFLLLARAWATDIAAVVPKADLWQAEGLITLPVALELRRRHGGRVVADVRDLTVDSGRFAALGGPWRALLRAREGRWLRSADAVLAANEPYAEALRRSHGIEATVVVNGPADPAGQPSLDRAAARRDLRARLGVAQETRVVLCVGTVGPGRGIEQLTDAIGFVPHAVLAIVGSGGPFRDAVVLRAAALPHSERIRFLAAVPPAEIPALTAGADVAAIAIQPTTLNHRLTTPTRIFDAIGAGVPVVASDLPGIASIVRETGVGYLVDPTDPAAIAAGLREVLDADPERRAAWREAAARAVADRFGWARQAAAVLDVADRLELELGSGLGPTSGGGERPGRDGSPTMGD